MRRLPLALVVWVACVLGAVELSSAVAGSIHSSPGGSAAANSADATATAKGSLFTAAAFGHALSVMHSRVGADARAETVAVYPGYLSADVVRGGTESDATSYTDGRFVSVSSDYIPTSDPLLPLSRLHPGDTAAIVSRLRSEARIPLARLRYMIPQLDPDTHRLEWLVYLVPGSRIEYLQVPGGRGPILQETSSGPRPVHR